MNEQAMKFRFGIFVLASLILLAILIMLFGGVPRYFIPNDPYTIILDNAQGISPGTPVRRSGVKVGEVRSVELDNATGKVTVGILVEHGFIIRRSDRPTVTRGLLGGDTTIDFLPAEDAKKADLTPVPSGSTVPGFTPPEASDLVQKTGELLPPAKVSLDELQKVLENIDKMTPLLQETIKEFRDVARATNKLVPELQQTSRELAQLSKSARQMVPELSRTNEEFQLTARVWGKLGERLDVMVQTNEGKLNKTIDQLEEAMRRFNLVLGDENQKNLAEALKNSRSASAEFDAIAKNTRAASRDFESIAKNTDQLVKESRGTIKQLNETLLKADQFFDSMQRFSKPLGERSPTWFKSLDESSVTLNKLLNDLRDLTRDFARSDGTLQKLMYDPSLYNNLNESACMLTRVLPRLDRILADVEIFSDKIARHPESLGIGGVVRPGSGLKEPPSVLPWKETNGPTWRIWPHGGTR